MRLSFVRPSHTFSSLRDNSILLPPVLPFSKLTTAHRSTCPGSYSHSKLASASSSSSSSSLLYSSSEDSEPSAAAVRLRRLLPNVPEETHLHRRVHRSRRRLEGRPRRRRHRRRPLPRLSPCLWFVCPSRAWTCAAAVARPVRWVVRSQRVLPRIRVAYLRGARARTQSDA